MQTIDPALQRSVWARVRGAEEASADLPALMQSQSAEAGVCRQLSRLLQGRGEALLRKLAARNETHLRSLQTLHFLETGRCVTLPAPSSAPLPPLPEALRDAAARAHRSAVAFERAAARRPALAGTFSAMAAEERRHGSQLLSLLEAIPEHSERNP